MSKRRDPNLNNLAETMEGLKQSRFTREQIMQQLNALFPQHERKPDIPPPPPFQAEDKGRVVVEEGIGESVEGGAISIDASKGSNKRRSLSDDSNRSDKILKRGHFDKEGTSGGGDHTIPDRLMKETLYSIIDYENAREIPDRINGISAALGLGNICENTDEIKAKFEEIKVIRSERKNLTRRLRGVKLITEDYEEVKGREEDGAEEKEEKKTSNINTLINISPSTELVNVLGQEEADQEMRRVRELLTTASNLSEEKLKEIGDALHTREAELYNERV